MRRGLVLGTLLGVTPAEAVQSELTVLLDLDNNVATGCTLSAFSGVHSSRPV